MSRAARCAIAGAIAAAALALPAPAAAQPFGVDCKAFSDFAEHLGYLRELGASLVRVQMEIRRHRGHPSGATVDQLAREARRVWGRRLGRELAAESAYERCTKQLGDLGKDS